MRGFYKLWCILVYPFFRIVYKINTTGRENIPKGPALVCANHSAYSDPVILAYAFGMNNFMRFMAKIELMRIPVLGYLLKIAGIFGVDRGNSDVNAVKTAMKTLKSGDKVAMFPEGTRVGDSEDTSAKTGAIMIAARTGVPIVPVYIPRRKKPFSSVHVVIGEPYMIEKVRGKSEVYSAYADELMRKIEALKP
ncbi:MAG: 1-acyl-sn-glycerol-3-phosphate acyltransferase [Clostridiales bacterium]|jgi:1-acyl-sn-glycerol-3-phosphate acyltransferase|nr:1-acyl-sn-glycerol-3-phosphate acyltransferase [Clostridiales bacterium]